MFNIEFNSPKTLVSAIQNRASRTPEKIAFLFLEDGLKEKNRENFFELDKSARAIAALLQRKEWNSGQVILLYSPGIEFINAFMGCLYAGVIPIPIASPLQHDFAKSLNQIKTIASQTPIKAVLTSSEFAGLLAQGLQGVDVMETTDIDLDMSVMFKRQEISGEDIAYLQFTSGSTATPNAVVILHKNLLHNLKASAAAFQYDSKSISLTFSPHSHIYGLLCGLLLPSYMGVPGIIVPPQVVVAKPIRWLQAISKYHVTHSGCPNFGYELCVNDIDLCDMQDINLRSWKVAVNGGETVKAETIRKFIDKFKDFGFNPKALISVYGMSEFSGTVAVPAMSHAPTELNISLEGLQSNKVVVVKDAVPHRKFVSNGRVIAGSEVVVVDPDTLRKLPANQVGEICLSGKSLAAGYLLQDETVKGRFTNLPDFSAGKVFFRTGDLGFVHKHEIYITGRNKEVIVLYGKKFYQHDLEMAVAQALQDYPVLPRQAVFSVDHEGMKDQIIFLQEVKEPLSKENEEAIIKQIRKAITEKFSIDLSGVILVKENSLPKTPGGKLQRKRCESVYLERKLEIVSSQFKTQQPLQAIATHAETQQGFINVIASVLNLKAEEIDLNAALSEFGFDSISIVKLTEQLNAVYQIHLTPARLFEYATLKAFFEEVAGLKNQAIQNQSQQVAIAAPSGTSRSETMDIAIIGMEGVFPKADNVEEFWENMLQSRDAISEIPQERWDWEASHLSVKWGGFVRDIAAFDAAFFNISPREAELTDPQQRLFLQVVWKAIEDAGYDPASLSDTRTGLFVGVFNHDYAELLQKNNINDAYVTTGTTNSILANRVSFLLNLRGPSEAIDTACSSSLVAIHHAVKAIHDKDCEVAIVGGVNALLSPTPYLAASHAGMLSPDGRCKTFDKNANGYVRAEGMGAIILKPLAKAMEDGDHIYAVIKGTAINHGGHVSSLTVPNPVAQAEVISTAWQRAGIPFHTASYFEAHGTGTSLGDPIEINGLKKAYQLLSQGMEATKPTMAIGSVKTHVGHLESAAGIAGIIKILLALKHDKLPANLHFKELNPYIEIENTPFFVLDKTITWEREATPRRAGISSFGFGGTNAHVVLEEGPQVPSVKLADKPTLIALSAKTSSALQERIENLLTWLNRNKDASLDSLSFTLNVGRSHFEYRLACVVNSIPDLIETLQKTKAEQKPDNLIMNGDTTQKNKNKYLYQTIFPQLIHEITTQKHLSDQELKTKLLAVANFYTEGFDVVWSELQSSGERLSLPTYPFAKEHYWIPEASKENIEEVISYEVTESNYSAQLENDLKKLAAAIVKLAPDAIKTKTSLADFGFDSISFKELASRIESHFKVEFVPSLFYSHDTVENISKYLLDMHEAEMKSLYQSGEVKQKVTQVKKKVVSYAGTQHNEPIAIIGIDGSFPQSKDLEEFWDHLVAGDDLVTEVPSSRWDWKKYYGDAKKDMTKTNSKWGAYLSDVDMFDAAFFNISAREANLMDPQQRLLLQTIWKTIEDAGMNPISLSGEDVGLFVGVEFNDYEELLSAQKSFSDGYIATGTSPAMLANRISYFLNFHGPSEVVDTACSSSLVAINRAVSALRDGECSLAIAGGVSLNLTPQTFVITSQLGALSPDGRCKTFDKSANGYVKGEGVATILLKPLSKAEQDGDSIYGVIRSVAVNHGGKAQSLTAPNASAQADLIIKTYQKAHIDPDTISYIEAHGTGTELGDPIEIEGLKQAFKQLKAKRKYSCGIGSLKTNIGHLEPASGIASVIKVLLAMKYKKLPPLVHLQDINPYIDVNDTPFYFVDKLQEWKRMQDESGHEIPRRAAISSFGFGGTNAHLVIEEAQTKIKKNEVNQKPYYLVTFSAKQEDALKLKLQESYDWLKQNFSKVNLPEVCYTLNNGRAHFDMRCAFVVGSLDELLLSLQDVIQGNPVQHCLMDKVQSNAVSSPVFNEIYETTLNTIKNGESLNISVYREKLLLLADLYVKGHEIDWKALHIDENSAPILGLPTYPFAKKRYWIDEEIKARTAPKTVMKKVAKASNLTDSVTQYLKSLFAEKLRIPADTIDTQATYEVYGLNSILVTEITQKLIEDLGDLPKTILYEKNNLHDLQAYLQEKHQAQLQHKLGGSAVDVEEVIEVIEPEIIDVIEEQPLQHEDIAIIGLHGIYPQANTLDEFWQNLISAKNCISEIPPERWNYKDYPVQVGGETKYFNSGGFIPDIDKFDTLFFGISPREAMLMDPQERLFMQSAWSALEDAGYTRAGLQNVQNKVGVFAGVTYNFYPLLIADEWNKGNRLPLDVQNFSVANRISYFLNLNGPSYVVDTACSSSLAALHLACESLLLGECQMAIAGGVNLSLHPSKYHFLGGYSFLSDEGKCKSFGEGGQGYVPAEGVGTAVLKPLSLALRDKDRIYGVIKASAMNHGGKTSGYTVPNPNAQAALVKTALRKANIDARTVSYVEAHGTGTSLGDPIEVRGLQEAFEKDTQAKQYCALGSVKSNIGHAESAAGISQLTKVLLQFKHHQLVPSLHAEKLNPLIDFANTPFFVQQELQEWKSDGSHPLRAGISSFGAGGTNIHVVVEEFQETQVRDFDAPENLFVLSAMNEERLREYAANMRDFLMKHPDLNFHDICYTMQTGRELFATKLSVIVHSTAEIVDRLTAFLANTAIPVETLALQGFYGEHTPLKISLPTYPFEKRRCWVGGATQAVKAQPVIEALKPVAPIQSDAWLYKTTWQKRTAQPATGKNAKHWIIFSDKELGFVLQDELGKENCTYIFASDKYEEINRAFYINADNQDDYQKVLQQINSENLGGIIYLWSFGVNNGNLDASYKLLSTLQALQASKKDQPLLFCLLTRGAQAVQAEKQIAFNQHHLWSMSRIFAGENGNFKVLLMDLDANPSLRTEASQVTQEIMRYSPYENHIAYRDGARYAIQLEQINESATKTTFNCPQSAIVTGGLGALGFEITKDIINKGCKKVLIVGHSVVSADSEDQVIKDKYEQLHNLQSQAEVIYAAVDVSDKAAMQQAITTAEAQFKTPIEGVFHLAGITTDSLLIADTSREMLKKVLDVKVTGALNLHEIFQGKSLKQFVLFSSIASLPFFGMSGLSAYAMANEFMNGLAAHRQRLGLPALSIAWAAWDEKGMSHRYDHGRFLDAVGMSTISIKKGLQIFDELLGTTETNAIVFKIDWQKFLKMNAEARKQVFFEKFAASYQNNAATVSQQKQSKETITQHVAHALADILQLQAAEIDINQPYSTYGLDSISGVNFVAKLGDHYPDVVSPMDLYRYPSVKQLVDYIDEHQPETTTVTPVMQNTQDMDEAAILKLSDIDVEALLKQELEELQHLI